MLIQYTAIASLDQASRARLAQAASGLMHTTEAANGYVMFEGKYFHVSEVQRLQGGSRQLLQEG
jgi:hypothetical protein